MRGRHFVYPVGCRISITNLAERHLRLGVARNRGLAVDADINHESSRKAFETPRASGPPSRLSRRISITNLAERHLRHSHGERIYRLGYRISITNLAERHLRLGLLAGASKSGRLEISITNLAERHLRRTRRRPQARPQTSHINHESSRKAFETNVCSRAGASTSTDINHESSRKAFETGASAPEKPPPRGYQSRI